MTRRQPGRSTTTTTTTTEAAPEGAAVPSRLARRVQRMTPLEAATFDVHWNLAALEDMVRAGDTHRALTVLRAVRQGVREMSAIAALRETQRTPQD